MRDRARRVIAECRHIATMTEEPGRIMRRFLTPPVHEVHAHLRRRMEALGMAVRTDAVGNLRGLWKPTDRVRPRLIIGSHIDTVPDAGAYDGVLGVILALEWVRLAQEIAFPTAIEIIAFSEEEGVRFGVPFIGSRTVAGRFDASLLALKDAEGVSLEEAIRAFGLDPAGIPAAAVNPEGIAFIEIHIEQGPVLEKLQLPLAVVVGTKGVERHLITFHGQEAHSGSTPMTARRDALAAAAKLALEIRSIAGQHPDAVCTMGSVKTFPGIVTAVVGRCEATLDQRDLHPQILGQMFREAQESSRRFAEEEKCTVEWSRIWNIEPIAFHPELLDLCEQSILEVSGASHRMPSGPLHDAAEVSRAGIPTVMLFVQSLRGISHNKIEDTREDHLALSVQALDRLASKTASWIVNHA